VLVVVDECAELSAAEVSDREERARRQEALAHISRFCRFGRASGIHVILCSQALDADAVPGQLKANIPATLALRVRGGTNSRVLLGDGNEAAAVLPPGPGRGIWQWDTQTQFQAWLSPEQAACCSMPSVSPRSWWARGAYHRALSVPRTVRRWRREGLEHRH
jgi:DNA segregation ATPase FtsK/SpoIIIE-like protein